MPSPRPPEFRRRTVEMVGVDDGTSRVAPVRTDIRWMRAAVPTRAGLLHIELDHSRLFVGTPVPVRIEAWSGAVHRDPAGVYRVDLHTGETAPDDSGLPGETTTERRESD